MYVNHMDIFFVVVIGCGNGFFFSHVKQRTITNGCSVSPLDLLSVPSAEAIRLPVVRHDSKKANYIVFSLCQHSVQPIVGQ